ncbi:MAG TPA: hypothetical protein VEF34_21410 [Syntrophobacteraceae bacterium]|nr:hypothetical protein [Syntrophobacteraceae bacterium]
MTLLRGPDGTLYDIPDGELKKYEIAPEDLVDRMEASGVKRPPGINPQQVGPQRVMPVRLCLKR